MLRRETGDLHESLDKVQQHGSDLIFPDTAPHSSHQATAAWLADLVPIVSRPAIPDLEAIGESVRVVKQPGCNGAIVLNACPPPAMEPEGLSPLCDLRVY